uniref:Uncharacterized protein n=1 Tax=Anguilla anguilla TaxID=7936 RepID=A0A0E9XC41_ANGAN
MLCLLTLVMSQWSLLAAVLWSLSRFEHSPFISMGKNSRKLCNASLAMVESPFSKTQPHP